MKDGYNVNKSASIQRYPDISSFCEKITVINHHKNKTKINDIIKQTDETSSDINYDLKIIITIPAFNEEETIENVILRIRKSMDNTKYCYNYVILVVDDGSGDETAEIATKAGAIVYSHPENYGLAETFRTEMKLCTALGSDIIVHTDADGQYWSEQIPNLILEVEKGYDLVLGSRFKGTIEYMTGIKRFGNKAFSLLISLLTRLKISDGQTGFRAFTQEVAKGIQIMSSHTYTQEQIIRAAQNNFSIKEIPIHFTKRNNGKSRLMRNPFEYAFRAWRDIIRIFLRKKLKRKNNFN
ncbi:MAG: glycosyltransferase family 2 protein [Asgard group archaeon]|nr:glycosyltransferase family 2 protein [Asgard group archaeon]